MTCMRCRGVDPLDLLDGAWATFPELYVRLHARTGFAVTVPEWHAPSLGRMMAVLVA
jgi:hypothetical protein